MKKLLFLFMIVLSLTACDGINGGNLELMILNPGIDTIEINEVYIDNGAYLIINNTIINATTSDEIDSSILGLQTITYTATFEDQVYSKTRYVMITDQTKPQLELLPGIDTIKVNTEWVDAGCIGFDNSNEILTITVDTSNFDNTTPGTYTIIYTTTDSSGNTSSIIRYITVQL